MSYEKAESLELVGLVSVVGIFSIVAGISSNFFALIVNVCYFQFEVVLQVCSVSFINVRESSQLKYQRHCACVMIVIPFLPRFCFFFHLSPFELLLC